MIKHAFISPHIKRNDRGQIFLITIIIQQSIDVSKGRITTRLHKCEEPFGHIQYQPFNFHKRVELFHSQARGHGRFSSRQIFIS